MISCIICREHKICSPDGMICKKTGLDIDNINEVQFCKFFSGIDEPSPEEKQETGPVNQSLIQKIQKLFELGKSPNLNEASAAIKKAEELMGRYNLSFGKVNYITKHRGRPGKKVYDWELIIFSAVCVANNCAPAATRGLGDFSLCGREINVFLSLEMFDYLTDAVKRIAKEQCRGKGHKYNHDFKMAAANTLSDRLREYGSRVSWAVDRKQELKNIVEYRKLPKAKRSAGDGYSFEEYEAIQAGENAGNNIGLHKQTGIEETKLIGA